jgi:hypothetical protein
VAENAAAGTNIGAPVAATDADKDPIAYTLKGVDRAYFALNNGSGQLNTRDTLDFEVKSRYSVSLLATDAKGGSDSITVTITVTDVDEVPITNPGTQAVAVVYPGTGTIITTPDGTGSVTIPAGSRPGPYHVRVDSDPANCGDGDDGEELQVCLTVEIFDSQGNPEPDAVLDVTAIVQMTLEPGELGGADLVLKAHEMEGLRFYSRSDADDEWTEVSFTLQADAARAAAGARSFGNFAVATDTEVFALAAQPDAPAPTPTPEPTPTIIPAAPAVVSGPPSSTAPEPSEGPIIPPVVSAGPVAPVEETGGFPWWLLLLIAVAVTTTAAGIYAMRRRRKAAAVPVVDPAEEDASEVPPFQVTPPVAVPVAVTTPARTAPALAPSPEATPALEAPPRDANGAALGRDLMIPTPGLKAWIFRRWRAAFPAKVDPAAEALPRRTAPAVAGPARAVPELPAPPRAAPGDAIPESTVPPVWGPARDVVKVELGKDMMVPTHGMCIAKLHLRDGEDFFEEDPAEMKTKIEPREAPPLDPSPPLAGPASPEVDPDGFDPGEVFPAQFYRVAIGRDLMATTRKRRWPFRR